MADVGLTMLAPDGGIVREAGSSLMDVADYHLFLRAGKEESVAATKTYSAELLVLCLS